MSAVLDPSTTAAPARQSLVAKIASRYSVEPAKLLETLKSTAFKSSTPVSNEQMMALLVVADQYQLNPFLREIYAFPDKGGVTPVVGLDGWSRIINTHPQFDGMTFTMPDDGSSCTCEIFRKDRSHALSVTEYMSECRRETAPWKSHPRRMLRHKAMIQTARLAFGFSGIFDQDEAERIVDMGRADEVGSTGIAAVKAIAGKKASERKPELVERVDAESGEITTPPATTYAQFADRLVKTKDPEVAALVMDEARGLPADQYDELMAIYARQFSEVEK